MSPLLRLSRGAKSTLPRLQTPISLPTTSTSISTSKRFITVRPSSTRLYGPQSVQVRSVSFYNSLNNQSKSIDQNFLGSAGPRKYTLGNRRNYATVASVE
uniref:Uncharacterized protein n=1 Tax=Kwoniella dejecticola CBS 10117 TaxID=1296121 RepID=A0A1A5ZX22_9TREE|nr:uncharacterized protein I303_07115 [Kwoniella dejecticola CBS 10117]OBR82356.1 hypothetical protein I303_07115 [Kwoniella dejecticola CBS 10117]